MKATQMRSTSLQAVEIIEGDGQLSTQNASEAERDLARYYVELGRAQAFGFNAAINQVAFIRVAIKVRNQKLYRVENLTWQGWVEKNSPYSHDTVNRLIKEFEKGGEDWLQLRRSVRGLTTEAFAEIEGSIEGRTLRIGEETFELTEQSMPEIVTFVEAKLEQLRKAKGEVAEKERQKKDAQQKAKSAEKALEEMQAQLDEARHPKFHDDPVLSRIIEAQGDVRRGLMVLRAAAAQERLKDEDRARLVAAYQQIWWEVHQEQYAANERIGSGLARFQTSPEIDQVNDLTRDRRDFLGEWGAELKRKAGK